eukprot:m.39222 g.39222  ORF g.39222 m.39222 type:complete len:1359 (-) comp6850_c0_seq1:139-4215(-)
MSGRFTTPSRPTKNSFAPSPANRSLRSLEDRINELQQENFRLATRLNEYEEGPQLARSSGDIQTLRDELTDKERLLFKARESMDAIMQKAAQEKKAMSTHYKGEMEALEQQLHDISTHSQRIEQAYKSLKQDSINERTILEMRVHDLEDQLQHQHDTTQASKSRSNETTTALEEQIKDTLMRLKASEKKLFAREQENEELRAQLHDLEGQAHQSQSRFHSQRQHSSQNEAAMQAEVEEAHAHATAMEARAKRAEEHAIHLKARLDEYARAPVRNTRDHHDKDDREDEKEDEENAGNSGHLYNLGGTSTQWKHDAEVQLQETKRELSRVRDQLDALKRDRAPHGSVNSSLRDPTNNASSTTRVIDTMEEERIKLKHAIAVAEDRERQASALIAQHEEEHTRRRGDLLTGLDARKRELEQIFTEKLDKEQSNHDRATRAGQEVILDIQEKLMAEREIVKTLRERIGALEASIREKEHALESVSFETDEKKEENFALAEKVKSLSKELVAAYEMVRGKEKVIEKAAEKVRTQDAVLIEKGEVCTQQANAIHHLHALLEKQEQQNIILKEKADTATTKEDSLTFKVEELNSKLEIAIDQHKADMLELERIVSEETARADDAEDTLARLRDRLDDCDGRRQSAEHELSQVQAALKGANKKYSELANALERAMADAASSQRLLVHVEEIEALNISITRDLNDTRQELEQATEKIEYLSNTVIQLEGKLRISEDDADQARRISQDKARESSHTISTLQTQVESLLNKNISLQDKLSVTSASNNDAQDKICILEGEVATLREEAVRLDDALVLLKTTLFERDNDVNVLTGELEQRRREVLDLKTTCEALRETARDLEYADQDRVRLSAEVTRLRDDLAQARDEINAVRAENSSLLSGLDRERATRHTLEQQMIQDRAKAEDDTRGVQDALFTVQGQRDELSRKLKQMEGDNSQLETVVLQLQSKLSHTEALCAQKGDECQEIRIALEQERGNVRTLRGNLHALEGHISDLQGQLQNSVADATRAAEEYTSAIHQLESGLRDRDVELDGMDELQRDKYNLQTDLLAVQETLNIVSAERDSAQSNLQKAFADIDELRAHVSQEQQVVRDLRDELQVQITKAAHGEHLQRDQMSSAQHREGDLLAQIHALEVQVVHESTGKDNAQRTLASVERQLQQLNQEKNALQQKLVRCGRELDENQVQMSTLTTTLDGVSRNFQQSNDVKNFLRAEVDKWETIAKENEAKATHLQEVVTQLQARLVEAEDKLLNMACVTHVVTEHHPTSYSGLSMSNRNLANSERLVYEQTIKDCAREKTSLRKQLASVEHDKLIQAQRNFKETESLRQELNRSLRRETVLKNQRDENGSSFFRK